MRTRILYIFILALTIQSFGQRKYAAGQYFKEYAYKKSAELYEQIFEKGDSTQLVLERLGDSYYYNTDSEKASLWYGKLLANYPNEVLPEYYFRYAQALKSVGNYKESDLMMKNFRKLETSDSRSAVLENTPDYVSVYNNTIDKRVSLHNVSTNTKYSDFGSYMVQDNFYFASSKPSALGNNRIYKWNRQPFLDLYQASILAQELDDVTSEEVLELTDAKALNTTLNTRYHEANTIITKDGQTMYFTRDNYDGKKKGADKNRTTHLKLYKATLQNGAWSNVVELPFNSEDYSVGHPALSADEETLYVVSDMPGGIGETDIYSVSIVDGSRYGTLKNLGKEINTEGREMFPFVSKDNVLYFSSDGHLGLGALDIFESKVSGNTFSKPKNIEAPFNSKMDDFGFIINEDKTEGFLSSNREDGKGDDDIYSFKIAPPKPQLPCTQSIVGVVTDSRNGSIIPSAIVKLIDKEGQILSQQESDTKGNFNFGEVPCDTNYTVLGEKQDYKSDKELVSVNGERDKINKADLALTPLIINNEIVINPIFFDFDKYNIRTEAAYELEHIVTVLNNHPDMIIKIESHTDCRGSSNYNRRLSDNRAKSTRDYIISRGISSNRIASAIGYGEDQLLISCENHCNNCSEEQHQRNRRSKFIIVSGQNNIRVNDPNYVPLLKIDPKPGRR